MSSASRRIRHRQPLSVFRPLPFPNPFGPAYAIDTIPERSASDREAGRHNRRNSGWSCDTICTWEQFATADPDDVLLKDTGSIDEADLDERRGPFERFVDFVDRALSTKLTSTELKEYKSGYTDGHGTREDPYLVKFLEGDKRNPLLHSTRNKWIILLTSGMATFAVAFGSSVFVGGATGMIISFHKSTIVVLLGLSFYVGGMGLGPMLFAPASELLGRRPVFIATFVPFFLFQIGCALAQNVQTMIVLRMLAGTIGSAPLTNSAGIVSDVFTVQERGIAMAVYALMPFLGPVFGPIVGGWVGEWNWRWLFWITSILAGVCLIGGSLIPETHAPVILRRRAKLLTKETGKHYASVYDVSANGALPSVKTYFTRPFVLLFRELIVFLFALYAAVIYGILYLLFGCYPVVFVQDRGWSYGEAGLPFIAVGLGMLFGMAGTIFCSIQYGAKLKRTGGPLPAEERLRGACVGGLLLPVGLAMFAATANPSVHWIGPTISGGVFGCAMLLIFMGGTAYLVDSYLSVAASAMAANSFMRSVFAAVFPLFTLRMFDSLGAPWSLGLLAFVCLACAPIPYLFFIYGERIRKNSPYAAAQAQAPAAKPQAKSVKA